MRKTHNNGFTQKGTTENREDDNWLANFFGSTRFLCAIKFGTLMTSLYLGAAAAFFATAFFQLSIGIVVGIAVLCCCLIAGRFI